MAYGSFDAGSRWETLLRQGTGGGVCSFAGSHVPLEPAKEN